MRFGVSTQLYHGERLTKAHLETFASAGFDTIELVATRTHLDYHDETILDTFATWLGDTGLHLHSIHAPVTEAVVNGKWGAPFSNASPDRAVRERAVDETKRALALAARVPVQVLVVHLGLPDSLLPTPTGNSRDALRRSLHEIAEAASAAGVRVALENIPAAMSTPESIVALLDEDLDSRTFGACLDFGHAHLMDGVGDAIETMADVLIATHVHDNHGASDEHLAPFDGTIDWSAAQMGLQKVGYDGVLMLEVAARGGPAPSMLERARQARMRFEAEGRSGS